MRQAIANVTEAIIQFETMFLRKRSAHLQLPQLSCWLVLIQMYE